MHERADEALRSPTGHNIQNEFQEKIKQIKSSGGEGIDFRKKAYTVPVSS